MSERPQSPAVKHNDAVSSPCTTSLLDGLLKDQSEQNHADKDSHSGGEASCSARRLEPLEEGVVSLLIVLVLSNNWSANDCV